VVTRRHSYRQAGKDRQLVRFSQAGMWSVGEK
jgi:hypothetical protein